MDCTYASVMTVGSFIVETLHPKVPSIYLPQTQRS